MFETFFEEHHIGPISILDEKIQQSEYVPLDLSKTNKTLSKYKMTTPEGCQAYIDTVLETSGKKVAFGGYLERRGIYDDFEQFSEENPRNIHLGMDFWCESGTQVLAPWEGRVHSFKNNREQGNYGPTIILEHIETTFLFYTLYGHLSLESLEGLYEGKTIRRGEAFATLGTSDINVNYAPHLHFQIIKDIQDFKGDYPGVCSQKDFYFYQKNCPNPNLLLRMKI